MKNQTNILVTNEEEKQDIAQTQARLDEIYGPE